MPYARIVKPAHWDVSTELGALRLGQACEDLVGRVSCKQPIVTPRRRCRTRG